jgi:hypothetical protein
MQAVLVMFRNDGERRSFSLSREMTVIGRRQDCDLMIPLGEISRKHCRIIRDGDALRIEDLGSSNGTFHNGRRIQEATLGAGDTLQVGPVTFVVQINGVPEDDEIRPNARGAAAAAAAAAGGAALAADDEEDALEPLPDDEGLEEATPSSALDTADDEEAADVVLDEEEEAMETPVIRKAAAATPKPESDEDALEADTLEELDEDDANGASKPVGLDDDEPRAATEDEELEPIGAGENHEDEDLAPISLDDGHEEDEAPAAKVKPNEDDLLDVLSADDGEEDVGEIDHAELLEVDEDAEEHDVTVEDEKPKRRK